LRLRRKIAARIGAEGGGDSIEVSLRRLVHTFGQSKIRDRVVRVLQIGNFGVDRRSFSRGGSGQS
jgi:hypothetical protein